MTLQRLLIKTTFAFCLSLFLVSFSSGQVILSTDFSGTSPSGMTLNNITYFTNGVSVPSNSLTTSNGNLFNTGATSGFFAPAVNTGNGGSWSTKVAFDSLAHCINLDSFELDWRNFNGQGNNQNAVRNTALTVTISDTAGNVLGSVAQNTAIVNTSVAGTQTDVFSFAGVSLAPNSGFSLLIEAADATTAGNNFGIDGFRLNGELKPIPEPSAFAILALTGVAFCKRRRR